LRINDEKADPRTFSPIRRKDKECVALNAIENFQAALD